MITIEKYADTWKKLWDASHGKLQEWIAAKDEEKLLPVIRQVFGADATLQDYAWFAQQYHQDKDEGERLAELVVTYGIGVLSLSRDTCEKLRLAIPYARGCIAAQAAENALASNGHDVPTLQTCRALTNRDDAAAKRLQLETLANKAVKR